MGRLQSTSSKMRLNGYQVPAWWYDLRGFFIFKFVYRASLLKTLYSFSKNISDNHLEVAVGSGSFLNLCLLMRKFLFLPAVKGKGFDYSEEMLRGAHSKFGSNPNWHFIRASVEDLKYKDNEFDTINIANAYHCFPNIELATLQIARVLKPGGTLLINVITPPKGNRLSRRISQRLITWGQSINIVKDAIEESDVTNTLIKCGLKIQCIQRTGNQIIVKAKRSAELAQNAPEAQL